MVGSQQSAGGKGRPWTRHAVELPSELNHEYSPVAGVRVSTLCSGERKARTKRTGVDKFDFWPLYVCT